MWQRFLSLWRGWDILLLVFTILLLLVGLAELYSSSITRPELSAAFDRQILAVAVGFCGMIGISLIDYRLYRSWSKIIYVAALVLLLLVLFFGQTLRGTTGWLQWGGVSFQPVELVKLVWIIVLASYLSHVGAPLDVKKTIIAFLLLLPLLGLILMQPDFGSGFMLVVVLSVMLAVIPKPVSWWLAMTFLVLLVVLLTSLFLKDYQKQRLEIFFNPRQDPLGSGYNVTQSVIAIGSGGLWGRGLGVGTQSQLKFLPEQHTDFVFASLAEELGLAGSLIIISLWIGFFGRIWRLLRRLRDDFGVLVTIGIFSLLATQTLLNIGMNLGLAPVVGITLPFISYGGSSLVVSLLAVGILQNFVKQYGWQAPSDEIRNK